MANNKVGGLRQVAFYVLCSILCWFSIGRRHKTLENMKKQYHQPTLTHNLGTKWRAMTWEIMNKVYRPLGLLLFFFRGKLDICSQVGV
jgi:hypothetical protein